MSNSDLQRIMRWTVAVAFAALGASASVLGPHFPLCRAPPDLSAPDRSTAAGNASDAPRTFFGRSEFSRRAAFGPDEAFHIVTASHSLETEWEPTAFRTQLAGAPAEAGFVDGPGPAARFRRPRGLCASSAHGLLFVADEGNHAVRAVHGAESHGTTYVLTAAGNGTAGDIFGSLAGGVAAFSSPRDVACGKDDSQIFVADTGNNRVKTVFGPFGKASAYVALVAGSGAAGAADGPAENATFRGPEGLAFDGSTLFVADTANHCVRAVVGTLLGPAANWVVTIAGACGVEGTVDGPGDVARFSRPSAMLYDGESGTLAVREEGSGRIRIIHGPTLSAASSYVQTAPSWYPVVRGILRVT